MSLWSDVKAALTFRFRRTRRTRLQDRGGEKVALGNRGEQVAERFLKRSGYRVLGRNVALRFGELDLVVEAPEKTIVAVEVKSGRYHPKYRPEMHVTAAKRRRLVRLLRAYLKLRGWTDRPGRVDVVAVVFFDDDREPEVRHHVNVTVRR